MWRRSLLGGPGDLGLDVVALFPSMQSATTGKIICQHVLKSPLKIECFNWKQRARYNVVNKKSTGDLKCFGKSSHENERWVELPQA